MGGNELFIYKNILWELLDEGSKLYILSVITKQGFKGECKLISKVVGDKTIMFISDNYDHELEIPIDILDIINN